MTFVTLIRSGERGAGELLCRAQFGFESFQIADGQAASIYFQHPFRLEVGKITGNEFAYGADLRREFLVADRKIDFHALARALAFLLSQPQQEGRKPVSHRGK